MRRQKPPNNLNRESLLYIIINKSLGNGQLIIVKENYKNTMVADTGKSHYLWGWFRVPIEGLPLHQPGLEVRSYWRGHSNGLLGGGKFAQAPHQDLLKNWVLGCQRNWFKLELPVKSPKGKLGQVIHWEVSHLWQFTAKRLEKTPLASGCSWLPSATEIATFPCIILCTFERPHNRIGNTTGKLLYFSN